MFKSQSAMEYLMTYGWSILIVAVVLGALSFLGVFNPLTFAPKASAGGCQVIKNAQLGVSNLVGSCNNQVPQYVAEFNGQSSYIDLGNPQEFKVGNGDSITISAWISLNACGADGIVAHGSDSYVFYLQPCNLEFAESLVANIGQGPTLSTKRFINVVAVNNVGSNVILYVNGAEYGPYSFTNSYQYTEDLRIGSSQSDSNGYIFNGSISNVQIYNTSLTGSSIQALYQEGIGGVPIDPQNLTGWWPLNGNANDYSGNQNNGVPTNVVFTSDWYNGYTQP